MVAESAAPARFDRPVFKRDGFSIGLFRAPRTHPRFDRPARTFAHIFVFPRLAVSIAQSGREPIVADPNTVVFYNRLQEYERSAIDAWGDRCEYFAAPPDLVRDAVAEFDPSAAERPEAPFAFSSGPSDAALYLRQRMLLRTLFAGDVDDFAVQEAILGLLRRVVADAHAVRGPHRRSGRPDTRRAHRELVEETRRLLAQRFTERLTLEDLGAWVNASPHHLCRIFRERTGASLHGYLQDLRLRAALQRIADAGGDDLTRVALDLGFSSHSHFTRCFRQRFGMTPSRYRAELRRGSAPQMRTIVTAAPG